MKRFFSVLTTTLALAACSGDKQEPVAEPAAPEPAPEPAAEEKAAEPAPAPAAGETLEPDAEGVVHLTANDQMKYNAARIVVPAGKPVKVELKHVGQMPATAMGHNFVLLQAGNDPMAFSAAAATAKDSGYIPADKEDQVIAHTKLLGGGESDTIEFDAPEPGTYPFLCSFPGHAALMKGEFVVE